MTCDDAIRAIEAMLDREIEDDERISLDAHLAGCEACRREVDDRREFSERLGRDLNAGFPPAPPSAPRIVFRPRRIPLVRWAAVILVGFAVGYAGAATGFFKAASAEAHEVANLSALKDAYQDRDRELALRLEQETATLDRRTALSPDGPRRDLGALCVMRAVSGLAPAQPINLPKDSATRARYVARALSSQDSTLRASAVQAMGRLPATDAAHVEEQIASLDGTNRTFTELCVLVLQSPSEPVVTVELENGAYRFVMLQNARVRLEAAQASATGAAPMKVFEADNVLQFRAEYPLLASQIQLKGSDRSFTVAGVRCSAPTVVDRPAAFVPAVVWNSPGGDSAGIVDALSVHAVMADCTRSGGSVEEAESRGKEVMRRVHAAVKNAYGAIQADPALERMYLSRLKKLDTTRLVLERERLHDEVAALERRVIELEQRLDSLRKATVALDYQPR